MSEIKKRYDRIVHSYVMMFCKKQETELDFWVDRDTFTVGQFGDHFYSISDIITDIEEQAPAGLIYEWQDEQIEKDDLGYRESYMKYLHNYKSALEGTL